ncbi:hypothetical protein CDAR_425781 [Caerostris darwini]|uniref:Uncharacterized protein n=1 Tax=Caerostris darwini TaxID=1538125 RepID=A0AAV4VYV1_9ARAC|nr:hypothetical protein CDAR_425781 [Caerostris darwini]
MLVVPKSAGKSKAQMSLGKFQRQIRCRGSRMEGFRSLKTDLAAEERSEFCDASMLVVPKSTRKSKAQVSLGKFQREIGCRDSKMDGFRSLKTVLAAQES